MLKQNCSLVEDDNCIFLADSGEMIMMMRSLCLSYTNKKQSNSKSGLQFEEESVFM